MPVSWNKPVPRTKDSGVSSSDAAAPPCSPARLRGETGRTGAASRRDLALEKVRAIRPQR